MQHISVWSSCVSSSHWLPMPSGCCVGQHRFLSSFLLNCVAKLLGCHFPRWHFLETIIAFYSLNTLSLNISLSPFKLAVMLPPLARAWEELQTQPEFFSFIFCSSWASHLEPGQGSSLESLCVCVLHTCMCVACISACSCVLGVERSKAWWGDSD